MPLTKFIPVSSLPRLPKTKSRAPISLLSIHILRLANVRKQQVQEDDQTEQYRMEKNSTLCWAHLNLHANKLTSSASES